MNRKKKLRIIQSLLLISGIIVIFFTYLKTNEDIDKILISEERQEKIKKQLLDEKNTSVDVFYNIEYSGLDLNGNRYNIKSKEAINNPDDIELVNMKFVGAKFYFKDDTVLTIESDKGIYNNKTLDIEFIGNVKGAYLDSKLFAQKASYSNSKGFVTISDNVKIIDIKGKMIAEKLLFDIKNKTLDISSNNDSKVKANINLK
tara:strand:+ start:538 stop:1143 length:606 start_codon:yes stop_codon:yes gene_type:complete